jgi:hypothetical protein
MINGLEVQTECLQEGIMDGSDKGLENRFHTAAGILFLILPILSKRGVS